MKPTKKMLRYAKENFQEVLHTTVNPEGPGVVRVHLIPPTYDEKEIAPSAAIINGQDIVPVNPSWSILLSELIREVNTYEGHAITQTQVDEILKNTFRRVRKVFPLLPSRILRESISTIMTTFTQIARGEPVDEEIGLMTMGEYAPYMRAPHRMDLMVSAMTKDGKWHCNQKCVHCYAAGQEHAGEAELGTQQWKEILDLCRKIGVPQVTFTGGEPTMREDLTELVDHARWFVTRLNTNGIRMTKELCRELAEASLDSCQITFYSSDPAVHNRLVGAEQYDRTVAGIENALEAGLSLSINTPLCTLNRDYLSTLRFLHEKGVLYVTCSGLITTGNAAKHASEQLQLTKEELTEILTQATRYCAETGMEISFTSPGWIGEECFGRLGISTPSCGACLSNMAVTPSGNVVPCQSWLSGQPLGNLLTDEWETIWNSPACKERRDYTAKMLGLCPLRKEESHA